MHPEAARAYKALVDAGFRGAQCYAGLAKAAREVLGSIPEPNQSASNQSPDLPAEAFIIVRDARRILLQPPVSVRMVGEVMKERSEFFASMIIAAVPRLGTELDFKEIEPFTNVDNGDLADDWAKGVRIEWLLGVPNAPSPSGLAAARSIVSKMKGGAGKYGDYILGLVHQAEGDSSAAATAYDQAFANLASGQPMLWQNEERRKLVASFYHTSAESRMARIGQGSVPHEIYDWYRKASEFHPQRPLRYHERTVLAGSRLAAPPWDTVEAYSSKLVQRLTELERPFEVMLANAKAHEQLENHAKQAFETYHDIAAWRLDKKEQAFTAVKPIDFYQKAVEPGIKLGNELVRPDSEPLMQVRMASLHAAKARLIRDDEPNWFDWKNLLDKPPWEAVIDAYSAAIHAHPANHTEKARYYAGRGWAKLSLGGQDLQSVLEDAQQAQRTDLNFPGGFALQGAYHQRQANRLRENYQNDAPEVMSELNKSKSSYDRATEKTGKIDDSERRIFHLNSSIAKVLYANFLYGSSKDEIRKTLNGAVEDATDACDLGRTPNTLGALGNAYEDLAWSKLGNDPTYYPKAERVFKDQVEMQQALPDASANLGRLYVKWYRDSGKQTSEYLDQARVSLENAIEIDTRLHASGGGNVAHSHYDTYRWMGELKGEQGKTGEQFDLYQQALTDPRVRRAQWHEIADLVGRDNEQKFLDAVIARPGRCPARLLIERSKLLQLRRNPTEKDFSQALADAELARTEAVDPSAAADACIAAILAKVELRNINGSTEARKAVSQYRREKIGLWLELVAHAEKGAEHPRLVGWLKELVEQMDRDYRAMPDQNEKILCLKHGVYAATVALNRDLKESDRLALERLKGQMESELKRLSRT
jgi:hypothetical protein